MKSLQEDMATKLLAGILLITYICEGAALLRKPTASDFLQKISKKRAAECFPGGCSTEVSETEELIEINVTYCTCCTFQTTCMKPAEIECVQEEISSRLYNGDDAQKERNYLNPGREAVVDEGSGM